MALFNKTLYWGKCRIEIGDYIIEDIQDGTTQLSTEQGDKREAVVEGGEVIATRYSRNKYILEFSEFGKSSVPHSDGIVSTNQQIRVYCCDSGKDELVFIIPSAVVNVQEAYTSEYGVTTKYSCAALRQDSGSIVWSKISIYDKSLFALPSMMNGVVKFKTAQTIDTIKEHLKFEMRSIDNGIVNESELFYITYSTTQNKFYVASNDYESYFASAVLSSDGKTLTFSPNGTWEKTDKINNLIWL